MRIFQYTYGYVLRQAGYALIKSADTFDFKATTDIDEANHYALQTFIRFKQIFEGLQQEQKSQYSAKFIELK
ncbi:hypothetical protein [Bacillus chungangensis]|uniref:Uncharacterized protein n=1 Tax=Bacillus chungangensis TaxID=587633 RepID=A0ABT9WT90_9BACI|nr:hypothetical protein [Bacillus chungangensis]MDQ0176343.1 hypothetical protein [Bacillus chungangensis]